MFAQLNSNKKDSIHYPIKDRRGDFLTQPSNNPFDLRDTSLVKKKVDYDPATKTYQVRGHIVTGKQIGRAHV